MPPSSRLGYPADHGVGTVGYFKDLSIGHTLQGEIKRMMVVELVRYSDLEHNAGGEGAAAAVEHPQRSVWVRMYNVPGHENAPQRVVFKRVTKRLAHAGRARAKGARSSDVRMGDPTVENPFLEFHVMQRLGSRYRAVCEERARVHEWVGKQAQGAAAAEAAAAAAGEDKGGEVMGDISSCNSTLSCPFRGGNGGVRSGARVAHHPNLIPLLGLYDTAPQSPLE